LVALAERAERAFDSKNKLVARLRDEVDCFMMSPECTPLLGHLDAVKVPS
jgi:hypothetical protein